MSNHTANKPYDDWHMIEYAHDILFILFTVLLNHVTHFYLYVFFSYTMSITLLAIFLHILSFYIHKNSIFLHIRCIFAL